jgi:hypothetical protein
MTEPKPAIGDLDAKRAARAQARAARDQARGEKLPIVFGGSVIAELDAEFPLDTLEPLQHIDLDMALLIQQAVANATATDAGKANMELVVNVLAAHPNLPKEFIGAVKEIGRRLLGKDGYAAFVAVRPTPWDVAALVTDVFAWYGVALGEALGSSESSTNDGGTSTTTSSSTSGSTPQESGGVPASPASLVSADSLG